MPPDKLDTRASDAVPVRHFRAGVMHFTNAGEQMVIFEINNDGKIFAVPVSGIQQIIAHLTQAANEAALPAVAKPLIYRS